MNQRSGVSIPDPTSFASDDRLARYLMIARAVAADIAKGRYPVGDKLPTETALMQRYGVSRHTVRQAMRELREQGLIKSHAGVGTTVRMRPSSAKFFSVVNSISDLLQLVETTRLEVKSQQEVVADAALAAALHCKAGESWTELHYCRRNVGNDEPVGYIVVYVRAEYSNALNDMQFIDEPIYRLIERAHSVRISEVSQATVACALPDFMADALDAAPAEPSMRITRHFLDRDGEVVEVSIGYYPGERYEQQTTFRAMKPAARD
jgi:DNA-binding GntR family transcriptional regulator